MFRRGRQLISIVLLLAVTVCIQAGGSPKVTAQGHDPEVLDQKLAVRTVVSGLVTPISMAFLGPNDLLVLEKTSGQVKRVVDGAVEGVALDLAVNFGSERGLLDIALHPDFPATPWVYLYWTASATGADATVLTQVPLLGNRVDRFVWNGATLQYDRNVIQLRALQEDLPTSRPRGNHNGGVIAFGPDQKLYIYVGDVGRRGQMQNLPDGPGCFSTSCPAIPAGNLPDDQYGGPEPDDAHLTGVILRLNDDGSTPTDNPFYTAGELRGGEVGRNLQKVFAYGIRNGFGIDFDPVSQRLWEVQNGDDTFTELNLVEPGANLGWVQVMGPIERVGQFRSIESGTDIDPFRGSPYFGLQQDRWSPANIPATPQEARDRLFTVYEGGSRFAATLAGANEVPPVASAASGRAQFTLNADGTLEFELRLANISNVTASHIHLGAPGQNGPVAAFLFQSSPPASFAAEQVVAQGTLNDDAVISRPGFGGTVAELVERLRQGRAYVNVHTSASPRGEIRGPVVVTDARAVSHYSDPEFSWKFEVAPAALGFLKSSALGPQYRNDLFVGAARTFLAGGQILHFNLTGNRNKIAVDDPRLEDRVADNIHKFDITESESLLFGRNFGVATDIQTGPNGNLFVVSLTSGAIYEIHRR